MTERKPTPSRSPARVGPSRRPPTHSGSGSASAMDDGFPTLGSVLLSEGKKVIRSDSRSEAELANEAESLLQAPENTDTTTTTYGSVRSAAGSVAESAQKRSVLYGGRPADECSGRGELCAVWVLVTGKWVNLLLLFLPIAQASYALQWGATPTFCFSFLAMVPLAALLGDFTEEVADKIGETAGGLMNASFGNAPELVFSVQALRANQLRVVQASLLGSILSNLLLVLGSSFLCGGLFSGQKQQKYNATSAVANSSLLLVSSLALMLPTPIASYYEASNADVLLVSRVAACFMGLMYAQLLIFQFKTHKYLFDEDSASALDAPESAVAALEAAENGATPPEQQTDGLSEGGDDEGGQVKLGTAIIGLLVITLLVAWYSDILVGSLDGFVAVSQLSKTFVGIVLIPVIGNVVEHIVAVTVAIKGKMELAMGIAVGSACQVSMFVIPASVLLGWAMDRDLSLNFPHFELCVYVLCVLIVSHLVSSGQSNWLEGSMLVTAYVFVATAFWFEHVKTYRVN